MIATRSSHGSCTRTLRIIPLALKLGTMPPSQVVVEGARPWYRIFFSTKSPLTVRSNLGGNRRLRSALGMNEIQSIITERVDDIPLLLAQMDRMGLVGLLDDHFPTHGNWQGLSVGRVATIWLSSILSRGDHRLVHVEPWVAQRQCLLSRLTGEMVRAHAFSDDRLEIVLRLFSDDTRWTAFESAL